MKLLRISVIMLIRANCLIMAAIFSAGGEQRGPVA